MRDESAYIKLLKQCLPPGLAYKAPEGQNIHRLLTVFAKAFKRVEDFIYKVADEVNPLYSTDLLDNWVKITGALDDCKEVERTEQALRNAVIAKWRLKGGASVGFFQDLAETYGYPNVTVSDPQCFRVGHSRCGDGLYGENWARRWIVEGSIDENGEAFRCGENRCGDRLAIYDFELLKCLFNQFRPAHTKPVYIFD